MYINEKSYTLLSLVILILLDCIDCSKLLSTTLTKTIRSIHGSAHKLTNLKITTNSSDNLIIDCKQDRIEVFIPQTNKIEGIVYVKNESRNLNCKKSIHFNEKNINNANKLIDFVIPVKLCGLKLKSVNGTIEATFILVIQTHPLLVTQKSSLYEIKCLYDGLQFKQREKRQTSTSIEVEGGRRVQSSTTTNKPFDDDIQPTLPDDLIVTDAFKEGTLKEDIVVKSNTILTFEPKNAPILNAGPEVDEIEFVCLSWLGVILSILLTLLLTSIALCIALSCWHKAKQNNKFNDHQQRNCPLPHPKDIPNPMLYSNPASTINSN